MAKELTQAQLLELGRKTAVRMEKEAVRTQARNAAVSRLIESNQEEFDKYLEEEKKERGL